MQVGFIFEKYLTIFAPSIQVLNNG